MRAIVQKELGGPEVLEVVETDPPRPIPTEVLVRVHAVGVNPIEAFIRSGAFPLLGDPPFTLGWDISGVVEHAMPDTYRFKEGDEVFGMPFFPRPANAYAEYVAAPARQLARKPASLDHVHAAALPLVGLSAWQGLVDLADLRPGQRVLIHGGGGGVGHLAVQLAKHLGAHVVATASAGKRGLVSGLGADEVLDYRAVDFTEALADLDVVFDMVGGDYGERSLRVLRRAGSSSAPSTARTSPWPRTPSAPAVGSPASPSIPTTRPSNGSPSSSTPARCACTCRRRSRSSGSPTRTGWRRAGTLRGRSSSQRPDQLGRSPRSTTSTQRSTSLSTASA